VIGGNEKIAGRLIPMALGLDLMKYDFSRSLSQWNLNFF